MKIKGFMLTGLLVLVLGFIGFAVAMTNLHWDFSSVNGNYEQKVYTAEYDAPSEGAAVSLEISADYADVTVVKGEEIKIEYDEYEEKFEYDFSFENGKLTAVQTQKSNFFKLWMFDFKTPKMTVTIPEGLEDAVVKTKNGATSIDGYSFKTLNVDNKNGSIDLKNIDADSASVVNVNGEILIDGFNCRGDFSVENKNGYIQIKNSDAEGNFTSVGKNGEIALSNCSAMKAFSVENVNGRVDASNVVGSSFAAVNKNGELILSHVGCDGALTAENRNGEMRLTDISAGKMTVNGNNGEINCERIDCPDIYAKNNNGGIDISVIGSAADYVITTKNNNGNIDVPKSGSGEKKLELINNNGDIYAKFV